MHNQKWRKNKSSLLASITGDVTHFPSRSLLVVICIKCQYTAPQLVFKYKSLFLPHPAPKILHLLPTKRRVNNALFTPQNQNTRNRGVHYPKSCINRPRMWRNVLGSASPKILSESQAHRLYASQRKYTFSWATIQTRFSILFCKHGTILQQIATLIA